MTADASRVQQKKRVRPGLERYESSDEHGEGLLETSMVAMAHPSMVNSTRKPDSTQFLRTADYEDTARLDSQ